jgi:hypothetical protein
VSREKAGAKADVAQNIVQGAATTRSSCARAMAVWKPEPSTLASLTLNPGVNVDSSLSQLCRVDAGATTMKGPHTPRASARWAKKAKAWGAARQQHTQHKQHTNSNGST